MADFCAAVDRIAPRDPFHDRRVIELALRLPDAQVGGGGWHKLILRQMTAGLLPDEVRWRVGKEHVGGGYIQALMEAAGGAGQPTDVKAFLRDGPTKPDGQTPPDPVTLDVGVMSLAHWIARHRDAVE